MIVPFVTSCDIPRAYPTEINLKYLYSFQSFFFVFEKKWNSKNSEIRKLHIFIFYRFFISAVFASFALSIMRAKRLPLPRSALSRLDASSSVPGVGDLVLDGQIDSKYYPARSFHPSWSFYVGWIGVSTCLLSSVCVYTLSRLMRYPPFLKVS